MVQRRRILEEDGRAALSEWLLGRQAASHSGQPSVAPLSDPKPSLSPLPRQTLLQAVRFTLEEIAARHPGRSVELRVPPAGAVQIRRGSTHRRGTPPAVVEMDMQTWLELATGWLQWDEAWSSGRIQASGEGAQIDALLPIFSSATGYDG